MKTRGAADPDQKLWSLVTATVRPLRGRVVAQQIDAARVEPAFKVISSSGAHAPPPPPGPMPPRVKGPPPRPAQKAPLHPAQPAPHAIEPGRRRRLERERDRPAAVLDLHGLNQDQARGALTEFLLRGFREHARAVLVITGKGALGDGVLRRRLPDWLGEPPLRAIVAGLSEAHRRHGGAGAYYVALKRPAD